MKRTLENILGCHVRATDGEIGKVYDIFLDDSLWKVRYFVVETGSWLNRRRVLLSPGAVIRQTSAFDEFPVNLSRDQVRQSPDVDTEKPVSRQQEMMTASYYGWPVYWSAEGLLVPDPVMAQIGLFGRDRGTGDPHLRSFREISNYNLNRTSVTVGKVRDFIVDDRDWSLVAAIASLGGWLDSRLVALPAASLSKVSWPDESFTTNLSEDALETLPAFDAGAPVNLEEHVVYFDYYGRPVRLKDSASSLPR